MVFPEYADHSQQQYRENGSSMSAYTTNNLSLGGQKNLTRSVKISGKNKKDFPACIFFRL